MEEEQKQSHIKKSLQSPLREANYRWNYDRAYPYRHRLHWNHKTRPAFQEVSAKVSGQCTESRPPQGEPFIKEQQKDSGKNKIDLT